MMPCLLYELVAKEKGTLAFPKAAAKGAITCCRRFKKE